MTARQVAQHIPAFLRRDPVQEEGDQRAAQLAYRHSQAFEPSPRSNMLDALWDFLWAKGICAVDFRLRGGCWEAELTRGRGWVRVSDLLEGSMLAELDGEPHLCAQLS